MANVYIVTLGENGEGYQNVYTSTSKEEAILRAIKLMSDLKWKWCKDGVDRWMTQDGVDIITIETWSI